MEKTEGVETEEVGQEPRIKEAVFSLNTAQAGRAEFISPVINGFLEAVIIDTENPVSVRIMFDELETRNELTDFEGTVLFDDINFSGRKFLSLRDHPVGSDALLSVNESVKWALNNPIRFVVEGAMKTTVKFVVRWQ